ncbi:hypothetical protein GCM10010430_50910 [Kitasatospora cystarginea]|uniref:Uncharacterized protein n=1 Tax=Kitasatospora cystarginea TaxID=58350 RepID=A0ABP5RHV4_9ACTN
MTTTLDTDTTPVTPALLVARQLQVTRPRGESWPATVQDREMVSARLTAEPFAPSCDNNGRRSGLRLLLDRERIPRPLRTPQGLHRHLRPRVRHPVGGSGYRICAGRGISDGVRNVDHTPVQASRPGLVQSVMSLLVATTSVRPEGENPAARSSE